MALGVFANVHQVLAVDCRYDGAAGEPLSAQYLASDWTRSGNSVSANFLPVIQWEEGEFLTDARLYCEGNNWQNQFNSNNYPQLSINNFAGYIKLASGASLRITMRIKASSNNIILGSGWNGTGVGATCTVSATSGGRDNCVIKFKPDSSSGQYVNYSRSTTYADVGFSAELTPPPSLAFADPLATFHLIPAAGNLLDFVYYIPEGLGYINDIESQPNGCGDFDDNGGGAVVPGLPTPLSARKNGMTRAGWDDDDPWGPGGPGGSGTFCGGHVGSRIPPTTIHLPLPLGGPGLPVNLSKCELTNTDYSIDLGSWSSSSVGQSGNAKPLDIKLTCTGGLNNVSVVFEDPRSTETGVTPFSDGITLHTTNGRGQLKNFKAEILHNGAASPVNIRASGSSSLTDAVSIGRQGTMYTGRRELAPVTQETVSQFSVRLHQTGTILDNTDSAYRGAFEGKIKYTVIYN